MNDTAKLEARLLTAAELELVAVTRPPEIERQSVDELKAAARRLREAHDRAKAIGTRQAREMRGKAEPRGATPARDNSEPSPRRRLCVRRWIGSRRNCADAKRRRLRSPAPNESRYCPMPGRVPMPLHRMVSITSSAPPAMEARRPSRKARLTGVSFMYPMPPQYCRQALGTSRPN